MVGGAFSCDASWVERSLIPAIVSFPDESDDRDRPAYKKIQELIKSMGQC